MEFAEEAILQGQGDFEGGAQDVVGLAHAGILTFLNLVCSCLG